MQREELDQVRRLYRLFMVYARVEACGDKLPERAALMPALVELAGRCWRELFGPVLEQPAHRRFVLEWCLRNVELLMKEEVLPVIAHQVVAQHIQSELAGLPEAQGFSEQGPQGPAGTALRRVYLIQSLNQLLARLAIDGQIPARLAAHLTGHLARRVHNLFVQTLGEGAESHLPDLMSLLNAFREAGAITDDVALKLLRVDVAASAQVSKTSGRVPIPAQGAPSPEHLMLMAGAGELMRRLRRQPSLAPEDRDRLIKRVEREMDDLLAALGPNRLDRALATLAERLGIPVPPPRDPNASSSGAIAIPRPRPDTSSEFQWAFELIEDLRRDPAGDKP